MKRLIAVTCAALTCFAATGPVRAEADGLSAQSLNLSGSITASGMRIIRSGAVPNVETDQPVFSGAWLPIVSAGINANLDIGPRVTLNTGIGGMVTHDWQGQVNWRYVLRNASAQLNAANLGLALGNLDNPWATLTAGFFGYTYTRVRDFGGYLYTAGLHPAYLTSTSGYTYLAGIRARSNMPAMLQHDLVVNLENFARPFMDMSIGYIATLKLDDKVELGAGVKLHRLVSAADEELDPELVYRRIEIEPDVYDTIPFSGTKLMARGFWDIPRTFGASSSFWGSKDLQVYSEAAILGLKDYPRDINTNTGYPSLKERVVVMGGVNMPTHPIIGNGIFPAALGLFLIAVEGDTAVYDTVYNAGVPTGTVDTVLAARSFSYRKHRPYVLGLASLASGAGTFLLEKLLGRRLRLDAIAVEFEYCGSPYDNNQNALTPLPTKVALFDQEVGRRLDYNQWDRDDWRWAVLADKSFGERFTVSGKLACDHVTIRDPQGMLVFVERLFAPYEWYWQILLNLNF